MLKSIGLMSGTSMDGIDAALLETDGSKKIRDLGFTSVAYPPFFKTLLKAAEYAVRKKGGDMEKAMLYYPKAVKDYLTYELKLPKKQINCKVFELADQLPLSLSEVIQYSSASHGQAVKMLLAQTGYMPEQIDVIGYHGQTLFHQPSNKISVIVGDGRYLANTLGITVINNFRNRDIAAGGTGAPFAPLYHHALALRDKKIPCVVINCGGIANITVISSEDELDLIAYDTGPGNGLIDKCVQQRTHGKEQMDCNGQYGSQGKVNKFILKQLYEKSAIRNEQNFFLLSPPKALDIGDISLIPELEALSLEDACATLEAFTADTIVSSLDLISLDKVPKYWVLSGGGWKNPIIYQELIQRLHQKYVDEIEIYKADTMGWKSQALEAQIFAYLAVRSLQNKPLSVPGTTGVPAPITGGEVHISSRGTTPQVQKLLEANPIL